MGNFLSSNGFAAGPNRQAPAFGWESGTTVPFYACILQKNWP